MWTLSDNKDWSYLEDMFRWVADMRGVPQDPRHHGEGDVAVHTELVLAALQEEERYRMLDKQEQELLWAAALLHDVEKRSTTVTETDGSITSRNHAKRGEFTTRRILFEEIPTPFFIREQIAALVRYHGLPLWIFQQPDPKRAVIEASLRLDTRLLSLLARADVLGRTCGDGAELLERIDFFDAWCQEQDCWGKPRTFPSERACFHYFYKEDGSPDYEPFDNSKGEVILLSGLPGMGKDRYIDIYYPNMPVVSLDAIRREHKLKPDDKWATGWAAQRAKETARAYLRAGTPFIWNATNITRNMRSQLIELFVTYKAKVRIVYLEVPYRKWLQQNNGRIHGIPAPVLNRMLNKLEVPLPWEAHQVVYEVG